MTSGRNLPSSSSPQAPSKQVPSSISPDYEALVRFLLGPFLEFPESLRVDCERSASRPKIWMRVAFEDSEKGRVFGRGGRNIQAIRTVVESVAKAAGYVVFVDIHNNDAEAEQHEPRDETEESISRSSRGAGRRESSNGRSTRSAQRRS